MLETRMRGLKMAPEFIAALRSMDEEIAKLEQIISSARSHSPFSPFLVGLSQQQAAHILHVASEIRLILSELADVQPLVESQSTVSAEWAAKQTIRSATECLFEAIRAYAYDKAADDEATISRTATLLEKMHQRIEAMNTHLA